MTKTILIAGNYNILHSRHFLILRFAKELGDKLIFAVYTDKSVWVGDHLIKKYF